MSDLVLEMCDPREREAELKELFARNGKEIFAEVFERAYRPRAEQGLRSWIALQDGKAIMHISVTPVPLVRGDTTYTVGIMGDLMVDDGHRDFWTPVKLLRKLTGDLKRAGQVDFLLSTTTSEAESVFKATGFKPFATLRRFVLPLNPLYLLAARLRAGVKRTKTQPGSFEQLATTSPALVDNAPAFRPQASEQFYATRIPRFEFTDEAWVAVSNGRKTTEGYALLARDPYLNELRLADAFWNGAGIGVGEIVHAAARWGRKHGYKKFTLGTIDESQFAHDLRRAGFFARDVRSQLLLNQISPRTAPSPDDWFLLGFALSGW